MPRPHTFCRVCKKHYLVSEMVSGKKYGPGYQSLCRPCGADYARNYRQKNKLKVAEKAKQKYDKDRDRILAQKREYGIRTRGKRSAYMKEYADKNADILSEKRLARERKRRIEDPLFVFKKRISSRIRKSFVAKGFKKSRKTFEILGIDKPGLVEYFLRLQNINILDSSSLLGMVVDHICPLQQAKNEDELVKLSHHSNLQIMTIKENRDKWNHKTPEAEANCLRLLGRGWES
jgi:5-methylcytosine-specific restriction endonuclease McrA